MAETAEGSRGHFLHSFFIRIFTDIHQRTFRGFGAHDPTNRLQIKSLFNFDDYNKLPFKRGHKIGQDEAIVLNFGFEDLLEYTDLPFYTTLEKQRLNVRSSKKKLSTRYRMKTCIR